MKKRSIIILISIVIALVAAWIIYAQEHVHIDYPQIAERGTINVVTDYNTVGYYVSGDTIAGFNHDLIMLLQRYSGLDVEIFLEATFDKGIQGLKSGKYDIIAMDIPVTTELKNSFLFTEPIANNRQVLIQRKKEFNGGKDLIKSHLDLAKKTLYVTANSPVILRIKNLSHEIGDTIYIKEDNLYGAEQLAMMVASKEIDYAVCDEKEAALLAKSIPEIDYSTLIGFTHFEAWVVRQNSPILLDSINSWIGEIKKTDDYKRIYDKYYK